jgi:transposase InsO family protein
MPWKNNTPMDQRKEFAIKAMQSVNFRMLCQEYGISTKTGYKWKARMIENGLGGVIEQSRKPKKHSMELSEREVCEIIKLKQAHQYWGPKKIRELYIRKHGKGASESSFKRVLERAGFVKKRKRIKATLAGRLHTGKKAEEINEVWTVDFKGWWRSGSGKKYEPLTIRDEYSRYIIAIECLPDTKSETVRIYFEKVFKRYGLPKAIRSDNGVPFAHVEGIMGLSRLSAWWLTLGISLERGRPGHPQDNGAHERMHRDIRTELEGLGSNQDAMDLWRHSFNFERPHEALKMKCPCEVYKPSMKRYEGTLEDLDYPGMAARKISNRGKIKWENQTFFISSSLVGWSVGLKQCQEHLLEVWFANLLLGFIDTETSSFQRSDISDL